MINNERNDMEITTDWTFGIPMRNYEDTLVETTFDLGEHGTTTFPVYRYNHNPMELYELNQNQEELRLEYYEAPYLEQACYKDIPMHYRWNPVIRNLMRTGNFRIRYRGTSKPQYGYTRSQYNCLAEYADTFAIYPTRNIEIVKNN